LFGVTSTDPATWASVALLLGAIAAGASFFPARRATRIDPLVALRTE
jgi:ABC-type antimicrobial peptide transport system permease subunit